MAIKGKWDYQSEGLIRNDIHRAVMGCLYEIMYNMSGAEEITLARIEGVEMLYRAIICNTEDKDENVQDD